MEKSNNGLNSSFTVYEGNLPQYGNSTKSNSTEILILTVIFTFSFLINHFDQYLFPV